MNSKQKNFQPVLNWLVVSDFNNNGAIEDQNKLCETKLFTVKFTDCKLYRSSIIELIKSSDTY